MDGIKNLLAHIKRRPKAERDAEHTPAIAPSDKARLEAAKVRARRLDDVVIEYTGIDLATLTGKDL